MISFDDFRDIVSTKLCFENNSPLLLTYFVTTPTKTDPIYLGPIFKAYFLFRVLREILARFLGSILVSTYLHNELKNFLKEQSYFFDLVPVFLRIFLWKKFSLLPWLTKRSKSENLSWKFMYYDYSKIMLAQLWTKCIFYDFLCVYYVFLTDLLTYLVC